MSKTRIYHNPRCQKSRQTLELLEKKGIEPEVIEYLKTPPSADELKSILKKLGLEASQLLRKGEFAKLGIKPKTSESDLVQQMAKHPILIERPIVIHGNKARLGRPPEKVLEIL